MIATPLTAIGPLQGAAQAFRLGMDATGCEALHAFIQTLTRALQTAPSEAMAITLQPWLEALGNAYRRGDYLGVADLLEYRIAPILIHHTGSSYRPLGSPAPLA